MIQPWNIKYNRNAVCTLVGSTTRVRIESVRVNRFGEVMYDVREIQTNEGYPALESSLRLAANVDRDYLAVEAQHIALGIGGGK
jgi:hypothetical protein